MAAPPAVSVTRIRGLSHLNNLFPTSTSRNDAGLPLKDNSVGEQDHLRDTRMDTDLLTSHDNRTKVTADGAYGTRATSNIDAETTRLDSKQDSQKQSVVISGSQYILAPYLTSPRSPEKKRVRRGNKRPIQEITNNTTTQKFAKFIVMSRAGGHSFVKVSPFLIYKLVSQTFGSVSGLSKMSNGSLLIEASSGEQSDRILKSKSLGEFAVDAELHKTLNSSRGMITCFDLENSTDDEILEGLKDQGVIAVRKFFRKKKSSNGSVEGMEFTGSVMLTFNRPEIPSSIQAAFYKLRVRPYVPAPLRCFKCQKFGHSAARCKSERDICVCGYQSHSPNPCPSPPKCPNCEGPHSSVSKDCIEYKIEKEIQKMKTELKDLTFRQARALVNSTSYAWRGSYSSAVKSNENNAKNDEKNKTKRMYPTSQTFLDPSKLPPAPNIHPSPPIPSPIPPPNPSIPMDENKKLGNSIFLQHSGKDASGPGPAFVVSDAEGAEEVADDGGGPYASVRTRRKKGRPKGTKNGPKKQSPESE